MKLFNTQYEKSIRCFKCRGENFTDFDYEQADGYSTFKIFCINCNTELLIPVKDVKTHKRIVIAE